MCENNARWCNKIYTFSVEEITELIRSLNIIKNTFFHSPVGIAEI